MTWRVYSPRRIAVERVLEVVEADPPVDEPLDRQPAVEVPLRVPREVDRGVREPVVRAQDPPALVDERVDVERRPRAERRHPNEDRRAGQRQRRDRELDRRGQPDRLEGVVRAAVGQVAERRERLGLVVGGEQPVRGAHLERGRELGRDPVDRHDP